MRIIAILALSCALSACVATGSDFADWPAGEAGKLDATGTVIRHADVPARNALSRHVDVWLPPDYATSDARYPVIYVNDGQTLFDPALSTVSGRDWGVDEAMTEGIADGTLPPAIIVGVWSTEARYEEYMIQGAVEPVTDAVRQRLSTRPKAFDIEAMNGDGYQRFLADELKPFIDRTYRTEPGRDHTYVMGASTGGIGALNSVLQRPDVFSASAGLSTHVATGQGLVPEYLADNPPDPARIRLYMDHGDLGVDLDWDYARYQSQIDAVMAQAGFTQANYDSRVFPGTGHGEAYWSERMSLPLAFLLNGSAPDGGVRAMPGKGR